MCFGRARDEKVFYGQLLVLSGCGYGIEVSHSVSLVTMGLRALMDFAIRSDQNVAEVWWSTIGEKRFSNKLWESGVAFPVNVPVIGDKGPEYVILRVKSGGKDGSIQLVPIWFGGRVGGVKEKVSV